MPTALAVIGIFTSSINWMSGDVLPQYNAARSICVQFLSGAVPVVACGLPENEGEPDHAANLQGLLFCLIVPSTLILISAKLFGTWLMPGKPHCTLEAFLKVFSNTNLAR